MKIKFTIESPGVLNEKCVNDLREYIKKKVKEIMDKYGTYIVEVKAYPRGTKPGSEEGRKMWFEEALESEHRI